MAGISCTRWVPALTGSRLVRADQLRAGQLHMMQGKRMPARSYLQHAGCAGSWLSHAWNQHPKSGAASRQTTRRPGVEHDLGRWPRRTPCCPEAPRLRHDTARGTRWSDNVGSGRLCRDQDAGIKFKLMVEMSNGPNFAVYDREKLCPNISEGWPRLFTYSAVVKDSPSHEGGLASFMYRAVVKALYSREGILLTLKDFAGTCSGGGEFG
ncbi:hypothetical protein DFH09DRAFT_1111350 [Mycena vulgaris]|nr:hypothetical protein DFH09DRAFT_1111350 [Mycena vulgaris]